MSTQSVTLAALISSRICHDLISPIGAIDNGLELLSMSGDPSGPEIRLISESVGNASARIRFFRIAFGMAGEQMVSPGEVFSILQDLYAGGRLAIHWNVTEAVHRSELRMAFLAILCLETAMPYGGRIDLSTKDDKWRLVGTADRINVDSGLWGLLAGAAPKADMQPSNVQFALLPLIAKDAGRRIICQSDDTSFTVEF